MKMILYIAIIVCSTLVPLDRADIAKLQPVEAAYIRTDGEMVSITTDTGAHGVGDNAMDALNDLVQNTPGIVYLDTAKFLLVDADSKMEIEYIREELKGNVKLCSWDGKGEISEAVKYLSLHDNLPKLRSWNIDKSLPALIGEKT